MLGVPGWVVPRQVAALPLGEEVADVACAEHARDIVDGPFGARRFEAVGVADSPAGHIPAVAPAQHAESAWIDEVEAPQCLVKAGHDVLVVAAPPVANHRAREILAV